MAAGTAGNRLTAGARLRLIPLSRVLAILVLLAAAACSTSPAPGVAADWRVTPAEPRVDADAQVETTIVDAARQPVRHAAVTIEAHMSHPGMAPIVERAVERGDGGVYVARLRLSMAGAWTLFVQVDRAEQRSFRHRLGEIRARPPD